jgi:sentrin-specific protease 7
LNSQHKSTTGNLKEYLVQEALARHAIDIDKKDISGMVAKGIPQQKNFSDCGIFVLAYIEKFMENPELFVRKILRRTMSEADDWSHLNAGQMRDRLRDLLMKLEEERKRHVDALRQARLDALVDQPSPDATSG